MTAISEYSNFLTYAVLELKQRRNKLKNILRIMISMNL